MVDKNIRKNFCPYSRIPIDRTEIPQSYLDIDSKKRSNLFTWNGQFSPQFIETLLDKYATPNDTVFDPFLGSGTTLCEAARKGLPAFGTELNVSAYYMAKTYEIVNVSPSKRQSLVFEIDSVLQAISSHEEIISTIISYISNHSSTPTSHLMCTLVILLDIFNNKLSLELLSKKWEGLKSIIINLPYSEKRITAVRGDTRKILVPDNCASLLISSPPYINVFNYHQKYRKSVELLGYDVLKIARNEFGSNRKNRGNRLLTVIQYCIDMALSISEAIRVCSDGARMIYVVGRASTVLGYSFCNSQLIYEIGTEIFHLPFILRQERVFKNRYGKMIYEDILHFSNDKEMQNISHNDIVNSARIIAVRMLKEKAILHLDSDNYEFLLDAIDKAGKVAESEE